MRMKHGDVQSVKNVRGAGKVTESKKFKCQHCGSMFTRRSSLDRHTKQAHSAVASTSRSSQSFNCTMCGKGWMRLGNLEMHMRTCTAGASSSAVASTSRSTPAKEGVYTVRQHRKVFRGALETHTVDMGEARQLAALETVITAFLPAMDTYKQRHAYKFQIVLSVVFHKAVDPAVVTQPPVVFRSTMAAIYVADRPNLVETSRHLDTSIMALGGFSHTLFLLNSICGT